MDLEWSSDRLLRGQQPGQIGIQFANLRVSASNGHAVAIRWTRRSTNKVVAFIRGENEQSIVASNAIVRQPCEELVEGIVVGFESGNITGLAGAESRTAWVIVMRIRNVSVGHRHPVFLQGGDISK